MATEVEIEMETEEAIEMAIKRGMEENHTNSDRTRPPGKKPSRRRRTSDSEQLRVRKRNIAAALLGLKPRDAVECMIRVGPEGNVLPYSANDLEKSQAGRAKNLVAFLAFVFLSVIDIPPQFHCALLMLCVSFLSYHQGKTVTTPFVSQFGNSTNGASVLSFGEAFLEFSMMIHMTEFILCYVLTLFLAWPLQVGVQICVVLLLIYAPFRFFPEMVHKASGVYVACGSFKLPLFWFATFKAVGLSLIILLLLLLVFFIRWQYLPGERRPAAVKELRVSVDDLTKTIDGVNRQFEDIDV